MFTATVELIILFYSNPLLMFFICNLIIFILHISNSKSNSPPPHHKDSEYVTLNPKIIDNLNIQDDESLVSIDIESSASGLPRSPTYSPEASCHDSISASVTVLPSISDHEHAQEDETLVSMDIEALSSAVFTISEEKVDESHHEDGKYWSVCPMRFGDRIIGEHGTLVLTDIEASADALTEVPCAVDEPIDYANDWETAYNEEEDELRKRVEDFIEKINRAWREEKLGLLPCVPRSTLVM